jgi:uncharacterized protein (TIGR03437 family)
MSPNASPVIDNRPSTAQSVPVQPALRRRFPLGLSFARAKRPTANVQCKHAAEWDHWSAIQPKCKHCGRKSPVHDRRHRSSWRINDNRKRQFGNVTGIPIQASAISLSGTLTQLGNHFAISVIVMDSSNPILRNSITYFVDVLPGGNPPAEIVADASQIGPQMTAGQLGMNLESGSVTDLIDPSFEELFASAGINLIRWPGGGLADGYQWQTNSFDPCSPYGTGGAASLGFDAFMQTLIKPLSAEAAITVNYGSNATCTGPGDPNEAAAWVNYANNTQHYGVKYWTVGNEQYNQETDLDNPPYLPTTYANRVATQFYPLMKAQDPTILVGVDMAFGGPPYNTSSDTWDPIVLANAKYDFVEMHYYPEGPSTSDDTQLLTTWSNQAAANFSTARSLLAANGHAGVPIFLGEFDREFEGQPGYGTVSIVDALFLAIVVAEATKAGGVLTATWQGVGSCLPYTTSPAYGWQNYGSWGLFASEVPANCPNIGVPAKTVFPKARAYQILSQYVLVGEHTIAVASTDSSIRAYGATNKDGYALLLINTDSTSTHTLPITMSNAPASSWTATTVIYGKQQYDQSAQNVWAGPVSANLGTVGATFNVVLPPWSMTLVKLNPITTLAPVINSTSPSLTLGAAGGNSLSFTVNASDPNGNSLTYAWNVNGTLVDDAFGPAYTLQLPLTAKGIYTVSVVISDGSRSVQSTWTVNVTAYRPPRFLFDETHAEQNTLNAARAQQLSPQNPAWVLCSILEQALAPNYQVTDLLNGTAGSLTPQVLSGADVLVLAAPNTPLTAAENQAVTNFVQAGGGLIFLGQVGISTSINSLIGPWGIQFNNTEIESPQDFSGFPGIFSLSSFANSPAVGVSPSFQVNGSGSLTISQGGVALAQTSAAEWRSFSGDSTQQPGDPNGPFVMVAAAQFGTGRVFVVSDNYFEDSVLQYQSEVGNLNLFLSGLAWVSSSVNTPPAAPPSSAPRITSVATSAGGSPAVAQNTWIQISGTNLAPDTRSWQSSDFVNGQMPTQLDGVSATVNGRPAFVEYISSKQVNVLTPIDGAQGNVQVQVSNAAGASASVSVPMQTYEPGFFVFNGGPYVAATHLDGSYVGPATLYPGSSTPARPGETVVLYASGFGQASPPVVNGTAAQSGPLPSLPAVTINGVFATLQFAGIISPGLYQFNVAIPNSVPAGDNGIAATYGGLLSQSGVLISIQP